MKRKICVVTGSRADYGLLYWLLLKLSISQNYELQIIATGMHLSQEFGLTERQITQDGFAINRRVTTLLSSDDAVGVCKSIGLGVIGFSEAFDSLLPDLVVVLGDRFEIFAAAQAAYIMKIPVAHIGGGDITEGAFDDAIRHSISKMSCLHFVTNSDSGIRLGKMGEDDRYIFNVGSPGLDYLDHMHFMSKDEVEASLKFKLKRTNFLITFHAATLDSDDISIQLDGLMGVLAEFSNDVGLIFTLPNADTGGREIINKILAFSGERENVTYHTSLGQNLYLSTLSQVDVVIGNSSSGLYEAPSIPVPTVNIGTRQKGRLKAESVFDCDSSASSIRNGIESALKFGKKKTANPYKQGNSAEMMMQALEQTPDFKALIMKKFVG